MKNNLYIQKLKSEGGEATIIKRLSALKVSSNIVIIIVQNLFIIDILLTSFYVAGVNYSNNFNKKMILEHERLSLVVPALYFEKLKQIDSFYSFSSRFRFSVFNSLYCS